MFKGSSCFTGYVGEAKLIEEEGPIVGGDGEIEVAVFDGVVDLVDAAALGDGAQERGLGG